MEYKSLNILVIDDDVVDVLAIKGALEQHNIANPVYVAQDGVRALEMLRHEDDSGGIPYPYLILLDLNLPRMNGLEFLKEIRKDPELRQSIVFVLTTSKDDRDKSAAYEQNVAGYVVKSDVGKDFINLVTLLKDFKVVVQFPMKGDATEVLARQ